MDYVIAIFGLGFIITLLVAKGLMEANDFANEELERQKTITRDDQVQK